MSPADLLPHCDHDGFSVTDLALAPDLIVLAITSTGPTTTCPVCGRPSSQVHGRYRRTPADLAAGHPGRRSLALAGEPAGGRRASVRAVRRGDPGGRRRGRTREVWAGHSGAGEPACRSTGRRVGRNRGSPAAEREPPTRSRPSPSGAVVPADRPAPPPVPHRGPTLPPDRPVPGRAGEPPAPKPTGQAHGLRRSADSRGLPERGRVAPGIDGPRVPGIVLHGRAVIESADDCDRGRAAAGDCPGPTVAATAIRPEPRP